MDSMDELIEDLRKLKSERFTGTVTIEFDGQGDVVRYASSIAPQSVEDSADGLVS